MDALLKIGLKMYLIKLGLVLALLIDVPLIYDASILYFCARPESYY
jgi:hypothetical protein